MKHALKLSHLSVSTPDYDEKLRSDSSPKHFLAIVCIKVQTSNLFLVFGTCQVLINFVYPQKMDLSLLPTSVSEHKKQSDKPLFTIRSASSPSYSLSRRGGVRKPRDFPEEGRERSEGAVESGGHVAPVTNKEENRSSAYHSGWRGSVKGQREGNHTSGHIMSTQLNQNGTADQTKTGLDTDRSVNNNPSSERRGRAEWKTHDLPSRSKSLDVRTRKRIQDRDKSHDLFVMSPLRGGKHAEGPAERRTEWEGERGRARSSVQLLNSVGTTDDDKDMSQLDDLGGTLNRADRGNSLPSKLGSMFGPGSDIRGMAMTQGPKGSQSILERIEKLYGSAGFSKTEDYSRIRDTSKPVLSHHKETSTDFNVSPQQRSHEWATGGTFPRRFSSGSSHSPGTTARPFTWTQNETSETYSSSGTTRTSERLGQTENRFLEDRGLSRGRVSQNFGTMSLDRVRSRDSIAAQLRSARAAGEITISTIPPPPNTSLQEEETPSWRDSLRLSERGGVGREVKKEFEEEEKRPDNGGKAVIKCSTDKDVFELHQQKATTKESEQKKVPETTSASSIDSVKNRINQFEALTQRFQDLAPGQSLPRRTFSVPSQFSRALGGVKKSSSAKAIGGLKDRSEGLKEAGETNEMFARAKLGSGRSLSVDEVGLRLEERERNNLDHGGNNCAEDFQKYSRLRNTLEIPPKRENHEPPVSVSIDETDFTKIPSPNEARKRPTYLPLSVCSDAGEQQASPSPSEDRTPSITPTNSPHLSPISQPVYATATHPEAETASRDAAKSSKQELPPLPGPLTTSPHSRDTRLIPSDVDGGLPNRRKQYMDAWLSGLSMEIKVWDDSEDDDDASTQKDEDSNYDSDSGESSFTITSNMSQSEQKSFCVRWVAAQCPGLTSSFASDTHPSPSQPFRPVQLRRSRLRVGDRRRRLASEHPAISLAQLQHVGLVLRLRAAQRGAGQAAGGRQEPGRQQPAGIRS